MPRAEGSGDKEDRSETRGSYAATITSDRGANAATRDSDAAIRDLVALKRDHAATVRDRAGEDREVALGGETDFGIRYREEAAEDRTLAAGDRARSAEDRTDAGADREQALIDLDVAYHDELTGFYRRKMGMGALEDEIQRARRADGRLVLAYLDVNGLKAVNDRDGHEAGDTVLRGLANALRSNLRPYDPVVRVGGDEFVCALGGIGIDGATERFAGVDAQLSADTGSSISVGLASLRDDDSLLALTQRGDAALRDAQAQYKARAAL